MKAKDKVKASPFVKMLLYGPSGCGKSSYISRAPKPYIIYTEPQGLNSYVRWNPEADVEYVSDITTLREIAKRMQMGKTVKLPNGQPAWEFERRKGEKYTVQTIAIDSLSDISNLTRLRFTNDKGVTDWGPVQDFIKQVISDFQRISCNLICTSLSSLYGVEESILLPMLYGKVRDMVGQWFNVVGYADKVKNCENMYHRIDFNSQFATKIAPHVDFPDFVINTEQPGVTTLGSLCHLMFGSVAPRETHDDKKYIQAGQALYSEAMEAVKAKDPRSKSRVRTTNK